MANLLERMPWVETIEEVRPTGPVIKLVDNTEVIDRAARALEPVARLATVPPRAAWALGVPRRRGVQEEHPLQAEAPLAEHPPWAEPLLRAAHQRSIHFPRIPTGAAPAA